MNILDRLARFTHLGRSTNGEVSQHLAAQRQDTAVVDLAQQDPQDWELVDETGDSDIEPDVHAATAGVDVMAVVANLTPPGVLYSADGVWQDAAVEAWTQQAATAGHTVQDYQWDNLADRVVARVKIDDQWWDLTNAGADPGQVYAVGEPDVNDAEELRREGLEFEDPADRERAARLFGDSDIRPDDSVPERAPQPDSWIGRNLTDAAELDNVRARLQDLPDGPVTEADLDRLGVTLDQAWRLPDAALPSAVREFLDAEDDRAFDDYAQDHDEQQRARAEALSVEEARAVVARAEELTGHMDGCSLPVESCATCAEQERDDAADLAGGGGIRPDRPVPEHTPQPGSWIERNFAARPAVAIPDGVEPDVLTVEEDEAEQLAYDRGEEGIEPYSGMADAAGPRPPDTLRDTDAVLDRIDEVLADAEPASLQEAVAEAQQAVHRAEVVREDTVRAQRCAQWATDEHTDENAATASEGWGLA